MRALFLGGAPALLGACAMAGTAPPTERPSPVAPVGPAESPTAPGPTRPESAEAILAAVVELALGSIGSPYQWGGTDANGFDCSGLIQFAYGRYGIRLPRVSGDQIRAGSPVVTEPSLLRPGDVLGFSADGKSGTSHVALYVGDDEFIHSSTTGVRVSTLRDPYWRSRLVAARRIVDEPS